MSADMKAAVFVEPGRIEVHTVPRPTIEKPRDAIVRIVRACVCGSDLWWYRGISKRAQGSLVGHEAIGVIDEVGDDVRSLKPGDFVIVPFTHACGECAACRRGFDANCANAEPGGNAGYQGEYLRVYNCETSLVAVPGDPKRFDEAQLASLLTLSDVMATGYHAARSARVSSGGTAVVVGDGAVGLCGVLSASMLGAERIIAMSRHADRQQQALRFGATDIVAERGDEAIERVMELTGGAGADSALECVGSAQSTLTALGCVCAGGAVGRVGVPHVGEGDVDLNALFWKNITLSGGPASVATYDREVLLDAVLDGRITPGEVFTASFDLADIADAYAAMDERQAIKSMVRISEI